MFSCFGLSDRSALELRIQNSQIMLDVQCEYSTSLRPTYEGMSAPACPGLDSSHDTMRSRPTATNSLFSKANKEVVSHAILSSISSKSTATSPCQTVRPH